MDENVNPVYKDQRYGQSRELLYSYEKDGNYGKTVGFHNEADRITIQQAWDHFNERIASAREKVLAGKVSPIVYYMEKNLVDTLTLSMLAGISLWRVKWHYRPGVFKRLKDKTLKKYADAFNITIEELKKVE